MESCVCRSRAYYISQARESQLHGVSREHCEREFHPETK